MYKVQLRYFLDEKKLKPYSLVVNLNVRPVKEDLICIGLDHFCIKRIILAPDSDLIVCDCEIDLH